MCKDNVFCDSDLKKKNFFSFLIVLFAWANVYRIPWAPLGVGEIILILFFPLYFTRKVDCSIRKYDFAFFAWFIYTTLITFFLFNYFDAPLVKFFSIFRVLFYWILIFVIGKNLFSFECFKKWITIFALMLSAMIVVQTIVYFFWGGYIPGYFLEASLNDGNMTGRQMYEHTLYMTKITGIFRPNGFLCEPAHCCEFLVICMMVFIADTQILLRKKLFLVSLISIAILLTFSTTGILFLLLGWIFLLIVEKKMTVIRFPLAIFFAIGIFYFFDGLENHAIERIVAIVNGTSIDGSSSIRLFNGANLYSCLPFSLKLFGTGFGLTDFVAESSDVNLTSNFVNGFWGNLLISGIVGTIIWHVALLIFFLKSSLLGKMLTIYFFLLGFGSNIYFHPPMVWIFLLILSEMNGE